MLLVSKIFGTHYVALWCCIQFVSFLESTRVDWFFQLFSYCFVVVVQSPHGVWIFVTLWTATGQASLSFTSSQSLPKFMSIASVRPSSLLILWCSLLLLPSIFPSIRDVPNESCVCIRWPKHWSFNFSLSPPNECSGLISLKIDWLVLLAVKGTLRNFLQHHCSKASILQLVFNDWLLPKSD